MTERTNRAWHLAKRPHGMLAPGDFTLREAPIPPLAEGQALARTIYLSLDPTNRIWASDIDQYMPPVEVGDVMRGVALGEIVESKRDDLAPGDLVYGLLGWQDHTVLGKRTPFLKVERRPGLPLTAYLGLLGFIGITAYVGIVDICRPKPGETLVVTTAAGAVGSIAAQIGKLKGCRVVGVTGTDAKCRWLTGELGLDAAINYKTEDVETALRRNCPDGVDCVFENVGGAQLDASLALVNDNARIALCGLIAQYNTDAPVPGPYRFGQILMHRVMVKGFIGGDHPDRFPEALENLGNWLAEGRLKYRVHVVDGLKNAPEAVNLLFTGQHEGKLMVRVGPEPA
ncbi:MAG: NADP-dependent oxidoreductase [Alphaproteobacteria bacterium]